MANGIVVTGDLHVTGRLTAGSATLPASSVGNTAVDASSPIAASKTQLRLRQVYSQESATTAADESRTVHVAQAAGTVVGFSCGCIVANVGDSTVKFDLKKNGTTVLTGQVTVDSGDAAYAVLDGTLDGGQIDYVADDVFEILIDATVGTGTLGKGAFAVAVFDEDPS